MALISRWFTLEELCRSEAAIRHGIDMSPNSQVVANLTHLAREVLDPIRDAARLPVIVTSGYRPEALNKLIGGSATSDHITGSAADIHAHGRDNDWLLKVIKSLPGLPLKQCILEFPPNGWVHVSIDLGETPKREFLTATRVEGRTVYALQA